MTILESYTFEAMVGDPDDHRPATRWAVLTDRPGGVEHLAAIVEEIAPGDRIPLHTHPIDEVVLYRSGEATVTLGEESRTVEDGAVVFIPAQTPHGTVNDGAATVRIFAVYPATTVGIRYLERNPAPGTEGDEPQPPMTYDLRTGETTPGY
jgi:quercetin dioxygenase-like cupin family protein